MKTCCVVVIGHVDHGKTALTHALTGIETDQLPEEKARGLTITPGFAHCALPGGIIDFVDAPGHADFIQGMISGATGAQAALVVISMAAGVGAQTLEHLHIAGLLGISSAVIAVTKSDLLPPSARAARLHEIRAALTETPFAAAPLVACSARSGDGIERVKDALENLLSSAALHPPAVHSFLPIDRVFTLPGRGTIVTGTLLGHDLCAASKVVLQPTGRAVTIRSLQSRGDARTRIHVGERMAANLRGVTASELARGGVLCASGTGTPARVIDAHLNVPRGVKHMQEVRVLFGTSSAVAQVRLFKDSDDAQGFAQLRFKNPVVGFAGQRAILRRLSPAETIGGAVFIDPQAGPTRSGDTGRLQVLATAHKGDITGIALALSAADGVAKVSDIARLARLTPQMAQARLSTDFVTLTAEVIAPLKAIKQATRATLDALAAYHLHHPLQMMALRTEIESPQFGAALLHHVEDALVTAGKLRRNANTFALWHHDPVSLLSPDQRKMLSNIEDLYRHAGLDSPSPEDLSQVAQGADLTQLLLETGSLVSLRNVALNQTLILHADTVAAAATVLAAVFPAPQPFTTSQARKTLGTTRRVIVPLLEHFDSLGVTIRNQNMRQLAASNSVSPFHASC